MSNKIKLQQAQMFNNGEELPIFTGGVYGSGVVPFVEREEGKQAAMFAVTFDELAAAAQAKKRRKAFAANNGLGEGDMMRQLSAVQSEGETE